MHSAKLHWSRRRVQAADREVREKMAEFRRSAGLDVDPQQAAACAALTAKGASSRSPIAP